MLHLLKVLLLIFANLQAYSAKDMAGLKVEHDAKDFREGSNVILTLKDTSESM